MEDRQAWFRGKRWGLFTHYLAAPAGNSVDEPLSAEEWNTRIDSFRVDQLAEQIRGTGADYFCITIGQNSGHYCAPNSTYDRLTGIAPSKCSRRDLVADLADALAAYGVDMWVYLPSGAPCAEPQAVERLEWENGVWDTNGRRNTCKRLENFQRNWESVIREWSLRWGDRVKGWWMDGCYFPEDMYLHDDEPNYTSLARALRAGNPLSVLAFNKGLEEPFLLQCDEDDFTAGEVGYNLPLAIDWDDTREGMAKKLRGKQLHVLSYLGSTWGEGEPRFPDELAAGYSKYLVLRGGIITWDIRLNLDGTIPESFQHQLQVINRAAK